MRAGATAACFGELLCHFQKSPAQAVGSASERGRPGTQRVQWVGRFTPSGNSVLASPSAAFTCI